MAAATETARFRQPSQSMSWDSVPQDLIAKAETAATELAALLARAKTKIVFAESCTAGLVSALLAQNPGVSAWHCGSAVTYREETKTAWLGVSPEDLAKHTAVSREVAQAMAVGVLRNTPEANLAVSVTGHLGPNAPEGFDGLVFIGLARKSEEKTAPFHVARVQLEQTNRAARQWQAAEKVLAAALAAIQDCG